MLKCRGQKCNKPDRCRCRMKLHVPIIWVLGGPGSGKGTQCSKIVEKYKFHHLSTGDMLREEVASESNIGKQIADLIRNGCLVPNEIVLNLLEITMKKNLNVSTGFLIDGYPREKNQGIEFETYISPVDLIIYFECSNETLLTRVLTRAAISAEVRSDDNETSVRARIQLFRENNDLILSQYQEKTVTINAEKDADDIFKNCCSAIEVFLEKQKVEK